MRILPLSGSTACDARSRACLAEPPAEIALDDEQFGALRRGIRAIGQFARQPQFAHRGLAGDLLLHTAANALLGALNSPVEELGRLARRRGEPVVEGVANHAVDQSRRFGRLQAALVLPLEFGLANKDRDQRRATRHDVVGCQRGRAFTLADAVRVILEARAASAVRRPNSCVPPSGVGMVLQ